MNRTRFVRRCVHENPSFTGIPDWLSALLYARGVHTDEEAARFLNPSLSDLHDPYLLPGMEQTVSLLRNAIADGSTIMVYGDYDADGVCAASILMETLHEEGASLAYYIPSRHTEGYGLNPEAVRGIAKKASLLITVDCGISNVAEVALAKELGLTVIITDHHQPPEELPPADVIMDPLLGSYPCPYLSGAGIALKISQAMQGPAGIEKRLELAALATVADVVPLLDENRAIVREGLRRMAASRRPGIRALLETSGTLPPLTADHLAFRLGPRLNAAGRLGDAKLGVHLLLTPDKAKAENIARMLEHANHERQELEKEITSQALTQLSPEVLLNAHVILVAGENWNPGLIGLTAGRLCEKFHLPAIALSLRNDGTAVGSCRSIPGVNIHRMLASCSGLLEHFGGHEQAAGLSVRTENIPRLKAQLEKEIASATKEETFFPCREYDLSVPFRTWTPETLTLLSLLEPTGCGNPAPLFLMKDAEVRHARRIGRDGSHLKLSVLDEDLSVAEGVAFFQGELADENPSRLDLLYRPVQNSFCGHTAVEAQIAAINVKA